MTGIKTLLQAAWIAPIDRPIIRDGAIVIQDGIIRDVGPFRQLRSANSDAHVIDAGAAAIVPGLVNPHTHLELSLCSVEGSPTTFTDWILSLRERAGFTGQNDEDAADAAVRAGIEQCLRYGVTCVGDISRLSAFTRPRLAASPLPR